MSEVPFWMWALSGCGVAGIVALVLHIMSLVTDRLEQGASETKDLRAAVYGDKTKGHRVVGDYSLAKSMREVHGQLRTRFNVLEAEVMGEVRLYPRDDGSDDYDNQSLRRNHTLSQRMIDDLVGRIENLEDAASRVANEGESEGHRE